MFADETNNDPPTIPALAGPEHLALLFNYERNRRSKEGFYGDNKFPHLTDGDIEKLIKLCYYASITPEEARFPRFRVFHPIYNQTENESLLDIIKFDPAISLNNIKDIQRLAPSAASLDYALRVIKVENEWKCDAIILADDSKVLARIGETFKPTILNGLMIRVDDPGNLMVSEVGFNRYSVKIRSGEIVQEISFIEIPVIKEWLNFLSIALRNQFFARGKSQFPNPGFYHHAQWEIQKVCTIALGKILKKTIDAKHGGAFLIIPSFGKHLTKEIVNSEFKINLKYTTDKLNLGLQAIDYWDSCNNDFLKEVTTTEFNQNKWYQQKNLFDLKISALANLANVDGCVVLDDQLRVIGFGGEILTDNAEDKNTNRLYSKYDWETGKIDSITEGKRKQYGTRNRSAFRFCYNNPGAIAFVISQDGDFRVYIGADQGAILFDNLLPWTDLTDGR